MTATQVHQKEYGTLLEPVERFYVELTVSKLEKGQLSYTIG